MKRDQSLSQTPQFDILNTPLNTTGFHLLEASAGSGKTYSISFIVLRLLVELQAPVEQILITTFTRAATAELRLRIRQVLQNALYALSNKPIQEALIQTWANNIQDKKAACNVLRNAYLQMERFNILSNDGLFQYLIHYHLPQLEYAIPESNPINIRNILPDINRRLHHQSWQVWQQHSTRAGNLFILLFPLPYSKIETEHCHLPSAHQTLEDHQTLQKTICNLLDSCDYSEIIQAMQMLSQDKNINMNKKNILLELLNIAQALHTNTPCSLTRFKSWLGREKGVPRAQDIAKKAGIEHVEKMLADCTALSVFHQLHSLFNRYKDAQIVHWFGQIASQCYLFMHKTNQWSYDSVQYHLANHVQENAHSPIKGAFKHVVIDEFQDTSTRQWSVLKHLINPAEGSAFLIGDPKQAIYRFRAADLSVYFQAKELCSHIYTLPFNWRSQPKVIDAFNQIFNLENSFGNQFIEYSPALPRIQQDTGSAQFVYWSQIQENEKESLASVTDGTRNSQLHQEIVYQCQKSLQDGVMPEDILILVDTNDRATKIHQTLMFYGIPSTYSRNKDIKIYQDRMLWLIDSIQKPHHANYAFQRGVLLCDKQSIQSAIDIAPLLQKLPSIYAKSSLLGVWQYLLDNTSICQNWEKQGEKFGLKVMQQCCEYLQKYIHDTLVKNDYQQLVEEAFRFFEQDVNLSLQNNSVRILTYFGAKGLEAKIVICPYILSYPKVSKKKSPYFLTNQHNQSISIDVLSESPPEEYEQEYINEQFRLSYVAITRACDKLIVFVYDVDSKNTKSAREIMPLFQTKLIEQQDMDTWKNTLEKWTFVPAQDPQQLFPQRVTAEHSEEEILKAIQVNKYYKSSFTSFVSSAKHSPIKVSTIATEAETVAHYPELPRGGMTGNAVHAILEFLLTDSEALSGKIDEHRSFIQKIMGTHNLAIHHMPLLEKTLSEIMHCPIPHLGNASLASLAINCDIQTEMPFKLFVPNALEQKKISQLYQQYKQQWGLKMPPNTLAAGLFSGIIDLVVEINGVYWIIDYKTNWLQSYTDKSLSQSMQDNYYGWQASFYLLALHRYLQRALPNYDINKHLGGALYFFVRGIGKEDNNGIYLLPTNLNWIEDLDRAV